MSRIACNKMHACLILVNVRKYVCGYRGSVMPSEWNSSVVKNVLKSMEMKTNLYVMTRKLTPKLKYNTTIVGRFYDMTD